MHWAWPRSNAKAARGRPGRSIRVGYRRRRQLVDREKEKQPGLGKKITTQICRGLHWGDPIRRFTSDDGFMYVIQSQIKVEMTEKLCAKRLQKEFRALCKEPVPHIVARPSPSDILEWHYVLEGSEGTPFSGGYYYGKIKFPPEYPYKPPGISMTTPNGRFITQRKICLSMSDFHPESWNPMWSVSSILTGLLSFMMDTSPTTGSVNTTDAEKKSLAKASLAFNCKNSNFRKIFPEYVEKYNQQQLLEHPPQEQTSPAPPREGESQPLVNIPKNQHVDEAAPQKAEKKNKKQSFPTWMLLLIFSIVGFVMALPLLQL